MIRKVQSPDGVLIADDMIIAKPHMDENEIVCWHYDHQTGTYVKGINILSFLYESKEVRLPVSYTIVEKKEFYTDESTGREKRRSEISKNKHFRKLLRQSVRNKLQFRYGLSAANGAIWYASTENINYIRKTLKRHFVMPLKSNRKVALSKASRLVETKNYHCSLLIGRQNLFLRNISYINI